MPPTQLKPGVVITIRRQRWRVAGAAEARGVIRVDATRVDAQQSATTFFAPFDTLVLAAPPTRPVRVRRQRSRAVVSGMRGWAEHVHLPLAAIRAPINLLPYQLEPLFAIRDGCRRVLLADAVGLGKTIQAGLLIAELLRRREAARVLVAAPSHLCAQWREELAGKFALSPVDADASSLAACAKTLPRSTNPWSIDAVWIGSIDFLKQPHVINAMPFTPWDLVVIDEAHMAAGASDRRAAVAALACRARRVLLLTATPVSGIADDAHCVNTLGSLGEHDPLTVFRRTRAAVGAASIRRVRTLLIAPNNSECRAFDVLDGFASAAERAATRDTQDATHLIVSVLRKRALSTFHALLLTVERRLAHLASEDAGSSAVQPSLDFGDDEASAITARIGLSHDRERSWMRRLYSAAIVAARASTKLSRLAALLRRTNESVIVFTEFRDSLAAALAAFTRERQTAAIVHGALTDVEMRASLNAFHAGSARVLLATDVASQGLNLHHRCRWVIHLDLPWNPIRLEQRAGRVDRIGQHRTVHVTQLVLRHRADTAFTQRLDERAESAGSAAWLINDTRWTRRARAAAIALQRRRALARTWRGPLPHGRPLQCSDADEDICSHDIDGAETMIGARAAPHARAARVNRIVAARARAAAQTERALARALSAQHTTRIQPMLPGAHSGEIEAAHGGDSASTAIAHMQTRAQLLDARANEPLAITTTRVVIARRI